MENSAAGMEQLTTQPEVLVVAVVGVEELLHVVAQAAAVPAAETNFSRNTNPVTRQGFLMFDRQAHSLDNT